MSDTLGQEDIYYDAISTGTLSKPASSATPVDGPGARSGDVKRCGEEGRVGHDDRPSIPRPSTESGPQGSACIIRELRGRGASSDQKQGTANIYSFAKPIAEMETILEGEPIYSLVPFPTLGRGEQLQQHPNQQQQQPQNFNSHLDHLSLYSLAVDEDCPPVTDEGKNLFLNCPGGLPDVPDEHGFEIVNPSKSRTGGSLMATATEKPRPAVGHGSGNMRKKAVNKSSVAVAKKKSRTLKRNSGNPFTAHSPLANPKDGAIVELPDEDTFETFHLFASDESDVSWSSSTFDSCASDITDDELDDSPPDKPLPPRPPKHKLMRHHFRSPELREEDEEEEGLESEVRVLPVQLKTPRADPSLPDCPGELTERQMKIRGVLANLTESEKSYIRSLERLHNEYRDPILSLFSLKKTEVRVTFDKVADILNNHKMCEIELGEKLKHWHEDEEIGSIFNGFSKQMVVECYSDYVNNFEAATEIFREAERTKPPFKEFLKARQMASPDRLSLPGLMLKPVQRFPQFIMIIKDLLKYTSRDHPDRENLQEALTLIENVAHQLNERKRQSEQRFHGHKILKRLNISMPSDRKCFLIRQDDVDQLSHDTAGGQNVKQRRLFLMSDSLVSVSVMIREQDGMLTDRYTLKWTQSLLDLELRDSAITPSMHTKVEGSMGNTSIVTPKIELTDEDPVNVMSDLINLKHDISVLGQISLLASTLKLSFKGLTEDNIHEHIVSLEKQIQSKDYQAQMLSSCSIILVDNTRKKKYIFQTSSPDVKQEWCVDFLLAKFALDVSNRPSWYSDSDIVEPEMPAYLMKHLSVDMTRNFTSVKCAIPVYFPTVTDGVGVQHLWVCSSTETMGQVSIVSLHTSKPNLVESFAATDSEIICTELVPGFALVKHECAFEDDTVWISTVYSEIFVFMLSEHLKKSTQRKPVHVFKNLSGVVFSLVYLDDKVFGGLRTGSVIVFSRDDDGIWLQTTKVQLGNLCVTAMIPVQTSLWMGCGNTVHIVDPDTLEVEDKIVHASDSSTSTEDHIAYLVKAGVGVWVSFKGRPFVALYHAESRKLLQNCNIGTAINAFLSDQTGKKETAKDYEVTSLMASLGLLWVGTNVGLTLTYPLPRLRAGVPRIKQRPNVGFHSHNGAVRFIIPVQYGPEGGNALRRQSSSVQRKESLKEASQGQGQGAPKGGQGHSAGRGQDEYEEICLPASKGKAQQSTPPAGPYEEYRLPSQRSSDQGHYSDLQSNSQRSSAASLVQGQGQLKEGQGTAEQGHSQETQGESDRKLGRSQSPVSIKSERGGSMSSDSGRKEEDFNSSVESHKYFILEPLTRPAAEPVVKEEAGCENSRPGCVSAAGDSGGQGSMAGTADSQQSLPIDVSSEERNTRAVSKTVATQNPAEEVKEVKDLSFRSELRKKVKEVQHQRKSEDLTDRPVTDTEVEKLYDTLMRTETKRNSAKPRVNFTGSVFRGSRMESDIHPQKPKYGSKFIPESQNHYTMVNMPENRPLKVSRSESDSRPKTTVGTSFRNGSTVDTLRKQDTNTMLVVTGGNGYRDWKKRQSPQYRQDEACLIFWMYKF